METQCAGQVRENNTVCKSATEGYPLVSSNEILVSREMLSKLFRLHDKKGAKNI